MHTSCIAHGRNLLLPMVVVVLKMERTAERKTQNEEKEDEEEDKKKMKNLEITYIDTTGGTTGLRISLPRTTLLSLCLWISLASLQPLCWLPRSFWKRPAI